MNPYTILGIVVGSMAAISIVSFIASKIGENKCRENGAIDEERREA